MIFSRRVPDWFADALVLLIAAASLFWALGSAPLRDNNEALYADIAWTMARGGSWIIPHLDGVPYIEKPPLLYWISALMFKAFGFGAWQARLPDALAAWLIALGCIAFGRVTGTPLAGRFSALVCGTALGFVLISRTILFDPLMLLFWLAALALVVLAAHRHQRLWLRLAMVPLAAAMLTKGPEALLLLGLVALLQLLGWPGRLRRLDWLRFYLDPWAIALLLVLLLPWHLAATLAQPDFAWFFFVNETVNRFLGTRVPADFHTGPWWYYGPKLLIGLFQWSAPLAVLAWRAPRLSGDDLAATSARWARNAAAVLIVFFSAAGNKGAYYLLPVVPLLAWWLGVRLQRAADTGTLARLRPGVSVSMLAFGLAALALFAITFTPPVHAYLLRVGMPRSQFEALPSLIVGIALMSVLGGSAMAAGRLQAGLLLFALTGLVQVEFATRLDIIKTQATSQKVVAAAIHASLPGEVQMFSWQVFEDQDASLLVYGLRPLRVIDSVSADLWFGCRHAVADAPCVGPEALRAARAQGLATAVWVGHDRLEGFLASGLGHGMTRMRMRYADVFYARARTAPGP